MKKEPRGKLIMLRRSTQGFVPAHQHDYEIWSKIRLGATVAAYCRHARDTVQHNKFWLLVQTVWENQERFKTTEALAEEIKIKLGYVDSYEVSGDRVVVRTKSISFYEMDQLEFDEFYNKAVEFICTELIEGLVPADLKFEVQKQLMEITGPTK